MEETLNKGRAHNRMFVNGARYLLEMVLIQSCRFVRFFLVFFFQKVKLKNKIVRTSEYVYLPKRGGSNVLCHTSNFQWERNVYVYLIVTGKFRTCCVVYCVVAVVKNLGRWIDHLIRSMESVSDLFNYCWGCPPNY